MIVYVLELAVGPGPSTVRVERHVTRPATGLWNWLRRRRTVTDVLLCGVYRADVRDFVMTRSTNKPSTMSLSLSGRDLLADLQERKVT